MPTTSLPNTWLPASSVIMVSMAWLTIPASPVRLQGVSCQISRSLSLVGAHPGSGDCSENTMTISMVIGVNLPGVRMESERSERKREKGLLTPHPCSTP